MTSWARMTLTWPKVTESSKWCILVLDTQIMSIHLLLIRLSSIKSDYSRSHGISQHFAFDLTSDVIGDLEAKFCIAVCEFMHSPHTCRLNFENPSVIFRDLGGGQIAPPPPTGRVTDIPYWAQANRAYLNLINNCRPYAASYHSASVGHLHHRMSQLPLAWPLCLLLAGWGSTGTRMHSSTIDVRRSLRASTQAAKNHEGKV